MDLRDEATGAIRTTNAASAVAGGGVRPAIVLSGLVGSLLVACAAMDGGALLRPDGGGWPVPLPRIPGGSRLGVLPVLVAHYGGLVLLIRAWLALRRSRPTVLKTLAVAAVWVVPLVIGPPVGSRDAYSYLAQGEVAAVGLDPYVDAAADLPPGPVRTAVDPVWEQTPTPYGPLFVKLSEAAVSLPGPQPFVGVLGVRALALAGLGLLAWSLPRLARALGRDGDDAVVLVLANPLVLYHLVGGGHNEALLAGFMVAGFAAAATGRRWTGVALIALGGAVKLPALAGAAILGWGAPPGTPWPRRVPALLAAGAVTVAVLAVCSWVTGLGWGWVGAAGASAGAVSWAAPATWLGAVVGHGPAQLLTLGLAGTLAARALLAPRPVDVGAAGRVLVVAALLGPALHPWYLVWGLPLLAAVGGGGRCRWLAGASIVAVLAGHPGGGLWFEGVLDVDLRWAAAAIAGLLVILLARRPLTPPGPRPVLTASPVGLTAG